MNRDLSGAQYPLALQVPMLVAGARQLLNCLAAPTRLLAHDDIYEAVEPLAVFAIHGYSVKRGCVVSTNIKRVTNDVLQTSQQAFERSLKSRRLQD